MIKSYGAFVMIALAFAILLPLSLAFKAGTDRAAYPLVRFDIEAYDPRDLLYGHYLLFRIKWALPEEQAGEEPACLGPDCCLCLGEGTTNPPAIMMSCAAAQNAACTHIVKGHGEGGGFISGLDRYYVDERYALPLEKLFRAGNETFQIELSMRPQTPILYGLYIGDRPYAAYLAEKGSELLRQDETTTFSPNP